MSWIDEVQRRVAQFWPPQVPQHMQRGQYAANPQLANPQTTPQVSTPVYDVQSHQQACKGTQPRASVPTAVPSKTWL